ncbi:MAG TPA: hypothetical protein ENN43_03555 [bacterium]|nr:hypothetical protein [bacterium]
MTIIILVILNIILIAVILLMVLRGGKKSPLFSDLEDMELIEFQHNLRELIDELNRVSETGIKNMDIKKTETQEVLKQAEMKIKELKYLIERNRISRPAGAAENTRGSVINPPAGAEENLFPPLARKNPPISNPVISDRKPAPKFSINEKEPEPAGGAESKAGEKYGHINNLLKGGMDIAEIAKVTGMSRGEIELIRNIKKG